MKCMRGTAVNLSYGLYPSEDGKHIIAPTAEFIIITTEPKYGIKTDPGSGERVMTKSEDIKDVRIHLTLDNAKQLTMALLDVVENLEKMERIKVSAPDGPDANAGTTPVTTDGTPATNDLSYDTIAEDEAVIATPTPLDEADIKAEIEAREYLLNHGEDNLPGHAI